MENKKIEWKTLSDKLNELLDFTEFRSEQEDYGNRFGWKIGYEKPLFELVHIMNGRIDDIRLEMMIMQILQSTKE